MGYTPLQTQSSSVQQGSNMQAADSPLTLTGQRATPLSRCLEGRTALPRAQRCVVHASMISTLTFDLSLRQKDAKDVPERRYWKASCNAS